MADRTLTSPTAGSPDAATRRHLSEALVAGRRRLTTAGAMTAVTAAATAGGFFAVAAIGQRVLDRDASWSQISPWLLLLAVAAVVRAAAGYLAARLALDGALAVEQHLRARLLDRLLPRAPTRWRPSTRSRRCSTPSPHRRQVRR